MKRAQVSENMQFTLLIGQLKGAAVQWLHRQEDWGTWSVDELFTALNKDFEKMVDLALAKLE